MKVTVTVEADLPEANARIHLSQIMNVMIYRVMDGESTGEIQYNRAKVGTYTIAGLEGLEEG